MLFVQTGLRTGPLELLQWDAKATVSAPKKDRWDRFFTVPHYYYFLLSWKQWYKRDHTHTHTNVDVEEIKDSLRMAWSSHLHFSSDTESAYCREKNEKTNFCCCYCCCDYSATPCPRVRPVTNHTPQPLFGPLFTVRRLPKREARCDSLLQGPVFILWWGWGEGSCLWSLHAKTRGRLEATCRAPSETRVSKSLGSCEH